ncbi:hypothetical protein HGRIS_001263 [Hohenbuehelia grisea]|uniref:Uncharacterized protein n=1 Tax=Hohenbuehelia grisea TaxID=104357 RepID=A0ABR3JNP7_9AGAR
MAQVVQAREEVASAKATAEFLRDLFNMPEDNDTETYSQQLNLDMSILLAIRRARMPSTQKIITLCQYAPLTVGVAEYNLFTC